MPEWITLELRPVWCSARRGSRSTTATVRPLRTTAWAVARPTIPPPTTRTSYFPLVCTGTIMARWSGHIPGARRRGGRVVLGRAEEPAGDADAGQHGDHAHQPGG